MITSFRNWFICLVVIALSGLWCEATRALDSRNSFVGPPVLISRNGRLQVDLTAAPSTYTIDGHLFAGMLYNGAYLPAIWRVRSGDSLTVTLHNHLSEPTNLHFHGLDVSPLGNGDNVFLHIEPGADFAYHIRIPQKHVGLFWFHPHMHGDVDRQIIGGMSGGIVVEGTDRLYPFLKNLTERIIVFKHHPLGRADYEELVTVNGAVAPRIPIRPGEPQLWMMGHFGADRFLRVKIQDMPFFLIGRDGYFVPRPIRMNEVILGPGQRASAIVVGGRQVHTSSNRSLFNSTSDNRHYPRSASGRLCHRDPRRTLRRLKGKCSSSE